MFRALALSDPEPVPAVLRDPGDDYLVEPARANGAEAIIIGDPDLLAEFTNEARRPLKATKNPAFAGLLQERLKGLEPSTFCMATAGH
jgi:predicted nucleic acid-binding protein